MPYLEILSLRYLLLFIWNWDVTECLYFILQFYEALLPPRTLPPRSNFIIVPLFFSITLPDVCWFQNVVSFLPVLDCRGSRGGGGFLFF